MSENTESAGFRSSWPRPDPKQHAVCDTCNRTWILLLPALPGAGVERTTIVTQRTRPQTRAFELLEVNRDRTVPINMTG